MTKPYKSGWRIVMFLGPHPAFCCMYSKQQKLDGLRTRLSCGDISISLQFTCLSQLTASFPGLVPSLCHIMYVTNLRLYRKGRGGKERGNKATLTFNMLTCGLLVHFNYLLRRVLPNNNYLSTIHSQTITHR